MSNPNQVKSSSEPTVAGIYLCKFGHLSDLGFSDYYQVMIFHTEEYDDNPGWSVFAFDSNPFQVGDSLIAYKLIRALGSYSEAIAWDSTFSFSNPN